MKKIISFLLVFILIISSTQVFAGTNNEDKTNLKNEDNNISTSNFPATEEKLRNKPKLIIDKYSFSPENPLAGEKFTMKLSFYNTNATKGVHNIKIFLTSNDSPQSANPNESSSLGSSVFTPVDSSNTFYIPYIEPNGVVSKEIVLSSSRTLASKVYQVVANFEYEDIKGNEYTAQELIGIPVYQESRLQTSEINNIQETSVGESIDVAIDFYNTGRDTLYNLMVKHEGSAKSEPSQYYVGNFQSGSSDNFSFTVTPDSSGKYDEKIVFTYEDSTGKTKSFEKTFSFNASEAFKEEIPGENFHPEEEIPQKNNSSILFLVLGVILLIILIVVILIIRKKRATKNIRSLI